MATPDARVAQRAARQWTIVDVDDLRACGLSDDAIQTRAHGGRLFRRYRGVYSVVPNPSLEGCFMAAMKACGPSALLSHFSAAVLRGWLEWDFRSPEVTASTVRVHPGLRVHRGQHLERAYVRGIPITTPAQTIRDLAAEAPTEQLRRAVNAALHQRSLKPSDLVRGGHRGAAKLRTVLATAAPTANEHEDLVLAVLTDAGLPMPDVNQRFAGYVPDFRWADRRVILEADGRRFHDDPLSRADDQARQAVLEAAGETVLRTTWGEIVTRPGAVVHRVRAALDGE